MWITIAIMVVSFLLTKLSGGSNKKALGVAAVAGAGTYLAVNNTEWGANLSNNFDEFIGVAPKPDVTSEIGGATNGRVQIGTDADGKPIYGNGTNTSGGRDNSAGGLAGLWASLGGAGQAAVGAGAGVALGATAGSFLSKYGIWILGGAGAYLLLKD